MREVASRSGICLGYSDVRVGFLRKRPSFFSLAGIEPVPFSCSWVPHHHLTGWPGESERRQTVFSDLKQNLPKTFPSPENSPGVTVLRTKLRGWDGPHAHTDGGFAAFFVLRSSSPSPSGRPSQPRQAALSPLRSADSRSGLAEGGSRRAAEVRGNHVGSCSPWRSASSSPAGAYGPHCGRLFL